MIHSELKSTAQSVSNSDIKKAAKSGIVTRSMVRSARSSAVSSSFEDQKNDESSNLNRDLSFPPQTEDIPSVLAENSEAANLQFDSKSLREVMKEV